MRSTLWWSWIAKVTNVTEPAEFERQYRALRHGKAFFALADWSSISIRGKDRQAFLHNFCTNDVKRLVPGGSCEAFITNVKGKIVGHGLIGCTVGTLEFLGAPRQAAAIIAHLDRYIIREDVQLMDTTETRGHVLFVGDDKDLGQSFASNALIRRDASMVGVDATEISKLASELTGGGFAHVEEQAFAAARIEAGFPLIGVDFDSNNLPQEIGRDHEAISFTKGCYLGQETVARIDALGHVNQRIVGVRWSGAEMPPVGSELSNRDAVVGHVTSTGLSPELKGALSLAMVRREANAVGTRLHSAVHECEVVEFPFRQVAR
jgi:folate-binding protein YgfZ